MKNGLITLLLVICLFASFSANAQFDFMKFGKIDENDLKSTTYLNDSTAEAVVLGNNANVYFQINFRGDGWEMVYERHVRIKILNKKGYDYANVEIPLYRNNNKEEKIISLKGATYNLLNGKVIKDNLKHENIFTEEVSERKLKQKFAMPSIREGCIIEYQYTMTTGFIFTLSNWAFQYKIPVIRSEFNACIPKYFNYNPTLKGYYSLSDFKTDYKEEIFLIPYKTIPQIGGVVEEGKYKITSNSAISHWIMNDVPAFKTEPYMSNENNFISALSFELASYTFPGNMKKSFTESWESINKDLVEDDYFGKQLIYPKFLNQEINLIKSGDYDTIQKIDRILEIVKKQIKWNGRYSVYASKDQKKIFAQHTGNSADINLMLISALKACGLDVIPVVLSTRDNGVIIPAHPTINQLNHVIALVKLGSKNILLDATEPDVPMGLLPNQCLNERGYMVLPNYSKSVPLDSLGIFSTVSSIDLMLGENNTLTGKVTNIYKDYAAIDMRINLRGDVSINKTTENIQKLYSEADVSGLNISNKDSINKPLKINFEISLLNKMKGEILYLNPFLGNNKFENPFKQEQRLHPIDFLYPRNETYIFKLIIPEGYEVIEKPETTLMSLPDRSMKVTYSVSEIGDMIQVLYKFSISHSTYPATDYGDIKAFFTEIVKKQSQNIVLKKKI